MKTTKVSPLGLPGSCSFSSLSHSKGLSIATWIWAVIAGTGLSLGSCGWPPGLFAEPAVPQGPGCSTSLPRPTAKSFVIPCWALFVFSFGARNPVEARKTIWDKSVSTPGAAFDSTAHRLRALLLCHQLQLK